MRQRRDTRLFEQQGVSLAGATVVRQDQRREVLDRRPAHDHRSDDASASTGCGPVEEAAGSTSLTAPVGGTEALHSRKPSNRKEQACVTYKTQPAPAVSRIVELF